MNYKEMPSRDELRSWLRYDEETGHFHWLSQKPEAFKPVGVRSADYLCRNFNANRAGKLAGSACHSKGYLKITVCGKPFYAHRLAWKIVYGADPDGEIDHINGDPADNRVSNLRVLTKQENIRFAREARKDRSRNAGIYWTGRRWAATLGQPGADNFRVVGRFASKREAYIARKREKDAMSN